jgi:hypothetical protein
LAVLTFCAVVTHGPICAFGDEAAELGALFRREYPAAARRLELPESNFSAHGRCEFKLLSGKIYVTNKLTVSALNSRRLIVRDDRSVKGVAKSEIFEVFCSTPGYRFSLEKQSPKSPYIISSYDANTKPDPTFERLYRDYALGASNFLGKPLIDRLRSPTFKIAGIKRVQTGRDSLIELKYSCSDVFETGTLSLDPSRDWVLRSVDVYVDKEGKLSRLTFKSRLEYNESGSLRIPSHMNYVISLPKNPNTQSSVVDFDAIEVNNTSESVFRLPAYGLPDIPLNAARTHGTYFTFFSPLFWVCVAGMIVSFVGLRILRRSGAKGGT